MREFLCGTVARIDMRSARLVFWDLGGQEDLQSLWDKVPPPLSLSLLASVDDVFAAVLLRVSGSNLCH